MIEKMTNTMTEFYNVLYHHRICSSHTKSEQCITNEQMHIDIHVEKLI